MNLEDLKRKLTAIEGQLDGQPFVVLNTFSRNERVLRVGITARLRTACKKGKVWKSKPFLTALKNVEYGLDETFARSSGGRDGIFLLDRDYKTPNVMMWKIFDRYLDKADSGVEQVAAALGTTVDQLLAVRLVSHHLRLLGVLRRGVDKDWLILVDYDDTK